MSQPVRGLQGGYDGPPTGRGPPQGGIMNSKYPLTGQPANSPIGYIGCPDLSDPNAFAARVSGDSMAPKYREGDIVIFSPAEPWSNGDDCFVRLEDGQTTFNRVFSEGRNLRLQPRNERHCPQTVPLEKVAALYTAAWQYRRANRPAAH
jgi:repressor LexA